MRKLLCILALCATQAAAAQELRFITCPIYRDTDAGRKSGCWLADDPATGTRYDVSPSASKPDWSFAVLIEGKVAATQDDACGGTVLAPVRTSVLETPCARHMLPPETYPGRKFVLPKRNVDPLSVARPAPKPPFEGRTFRLFFDWDSDFLAYQREDWSLDQAIGWIRGVPFSKIIVTGYAAKAASLVSGQMIAEQSGLAQKRAEHVAEALFRLGIAKDKIHVQSGGNGTLVSDDWVDGLTEPSRRRVEISVILVKP